MFQALRRHLSYSNVAATMALVFALTGGALAASSHGGESSSPAKVSASAGRAAGFTAVTAKKKSKPKSLRGPAGPAGKNGTNGTNGAPGATGPAGPTGPAGAGTQGEKGVEGKQGSEGKSGFTKTLPSGETETGQFAFAQEGAAEGAALRVAISFPIPLATTSLPHFIGEEEGEGEPKAHVPAGCKGTSAKPEAEPGNLCVFAKVLQAAEFKVFIDGGTQSTTATGLTGDTMFFGALHIESAPGFFETPQAYGTWAVTAE